MNINDDELSIAFEPPVSDLDEQKPVLGKTRGKGRPKTSEILSLIHI